MTDKEELYETLGELIYVVAKADGIIQEKEVDALTKILENHPWASTIQWSFDYEVNRADDIDFVYKKVMDFCYQFGPTPEYHEFIDVMMEIADASDGIDKAEAKVISSFSRDLIDRFNRDIEKIKSQEDKE